MNGEIFAFFSLGNPTNCCTNCATRPKGVNVLQFMQIKITKKTWVVVQAPRFSSVNSALSANQIYTSYPDAGGFKMALSYGVSASRWASPT